MDQEDRKALLDAFRPYRSPQVVDALYFMNAAHLMVMDPGIHSTNPGLSMHGFAFTVRYVPTQDPFSCITPEQRERVIQDPTALMFEDGRGGLADPNSWMTDHIHHRGTLDQAKRDDVLVVDGGGTPHIHWGGSINMQGLAMGLAGVVCDGGVRDLVETRPTDMAIFARHVSNVFHSPWVELAEVKGKITCGGVQVKQGDILVGDDDGVVVVPIELASEVVRLLPAIQATDDVVQARWSQR